tara:strand:+ start:135 stop:263 length:129 start_codon:yes stop_codon:yes gene_type:complete
MPINKLDDFQKNQYHYLAKKSQRADAEKFIWIEEWEKISLIN